MTNSSVSSLRAKFDGASLIFRLIHSCRTTSSTVSVGSMRARTVKPSLVVTLLVGTSAPDFTWVPLAAVDEGKEFLRPGCAEVDELPAVDMNQRHCVMFNLIRNQGRAGVDDPI